MPGLPPGELHEDVLQRPLAGAQFGDDDAARHEPLVDLARAGRVDSDVEPALAHGLHVLAADEFLKETHRALGRTCANEQLCPTANLVHGSLGHQPSLDRKSTRLNSSHMSI